MRGSYYDSKTEITFWMEDTYKVNIRVNQYITSLNISKQSCPGRFAHNKPNCDWLCA